MLIISSELEGIGNFTSKGSSGYNGASYNRYYQGYGRPVVVEVVLLIYLLKIGKLSESNCTYICSGGTGGSGANGGTYGGAGGTGTVTVGTIVGGYYTDLNI